MTIPSIITECCMSISGNTLSVRIPNGASFDANIECGASKLYDVFISFGIQKYSVSEVEEMLKYFFDKRPHKVLETLPPGTKLYVAGHGREELREVYVAGPGKEIKEASAMRQESTYLSGITKYVDENINKGVTLASAAGIKSEGDIYPKDVILPSGKKKPGPAKGAKRKG